MNRFLAVSTLVGVLSFATTVQSASAEILWQGDFSTGNFSQWPNTDKDLRNVGFMFVPPRGSPNKANLAVGYSYSYRSGTWFDGRLTWDGQPGDGSLLSLVHSSGTSAAPKGPTRGASPYAAKFVVKSQAGGGAEPADCDIPTIDCGRRRVQLHAIQSIAQHFSPNVHLKTRWYSVSIFIPEDQPDISDGRWGPSYFSVIKAVQRPGGIVSILRDTNSGNWEIQTDHSRNPNSLPTDPLSEWWQTCRYTQAVGVSRYPELQSDFPDPAASRAALANLNKGGWTDFVFRITYDWRVVGGTGSMDVWMRAGSGAARDAEPKPWVHAIRQRPTMLKRDAEHTLERGIGFNFEDGNNGGAPGIYAGIYTSKESVWNKARNHEVFIANVQVGGDKSSLEEMSPDGSSPMSSVPKPPATLDVR